MNITITGSLGSGKSSLCRTLETEGWDIVSSGMIFREAAEEAGMDVLQLNASLVNDRLLDEKIDSRTSELGKTLDHTVFDGRLAWNFVKDSFKIFLFCCSDVAAKRVYENTRIAEKYDSVEACETALLGRQKEERERFIDFYDVDYLDMSNYDLVVDTSYATPEQVFALVKQGIGEAEKEIRDIGYMSQCAHVAVLENETAADGEHTPLTER